MRNSWLAMMVAAGMLAGCGGGSPGSGDNAVQLPSGPAVYAAAKATVGDYYSFESVTRNANAADSYNYVTRTVRSVAADGAATINFFNDYVTSTVPLAFASSNGIVDLDRLGRMTSTRDGNCVTTPNPAFYPVAPYSVSAGMNSQYSGVVQTKCGQDPATQATLSHTDTVGALEAVTVPAGTFNAFKVTRRGNNEDGNSRFVGERTCWWDPEMGMEVKCVINSTTTNKASGQSRTTEETVTLQGYSNQKLARKADTMLRVMGTWSGTYAGTALGQNAVGTCSLTIGADGNIAGGCLGVAVVFSITGRVNVDGTLSFTLTNNGNAGQSFTGKLDSIEQMSGAWNVPNYGQGTWIMSQD